MTHTESFPKKLSQNCVNRQTKPFIDTNLQIQVPFEGKFLSEQIGINPIYTHYINERQSSPILGSVVNLTEVEQTIRQTKETYSLWKKMQQRLAEQLNEAIK